MAKTKTQDIKNRSPREIELFRFLHAQKGATFDQIKKELFKNLKDNTVYFRLAQLQKLELLDGYTSNSIGKRKYYFLTKKAFRLFLSKGDENNIQLRSDATQHDLEMTDLRSRLLSSTRVVDYLSENSLQTWGPLLWGEEFDPYFRMRSDACIKVFLQNNAYWSALEYEASLQNEIRIKKRLLGYYSAPDIPLVFVICKTSSIFDRMRQLEKDHFSHYKPKFFYKLLSEFETDKDLIFYNRENKIMRLNEEISIPKPCKIRPSDL